MIVTCPVCKTEFESKPYAEVFGQQFHHCPKCQNDFYDIKNQEELNSDE